MAQNAKPEPEGSRYVLIDALSLATDAEAPTPRDVLKIVIRLECARAGLPKPDFDCFPPEAVINQVLFPESD